MAKNDRRERERKTITRRERPQRLGPRVLSGIKGESTNSVKAIYVLPEAHGKGLGKALIQRTLEWLGDDAPTILSVAKYNVHAIGFYEKMGFVLGADVPTEETLTLASGRRIPEVKMIRANQT